MYVNKIDAVNWMQVFKKSVVLICLMFWLGLVEAYAQFYYPVPRLVDPAKENQLSVTLQNSKPDKARVKILLDLGNISLNKPIRNATNLNRAMHFGREAVDLSKRVGDSSGYNRASVFVGDVYTHQNKMANAEGILAQVNDTARIDLLLNLAYKYWQRDMPKKEDDWKKALGFAEQARLLSIRHHFTDKEILALKNVAMVHADQGKSSAEAELLDVIRRYKAIHYPYLHYTYAQLAELNWSRGNPDKAVKYIIETIKVMKSTGDTTAAGDFYVLRTNISINNEDYVQGLYFAKLAVESYKIHPGRYNLANRDIFSLAVRALRKLKNYPEALAFIKKAMREYPPESRENQISYYTMLGNVYRDMKKFDEAEHWFLKTADLSKKDGGMAYLEATHNLGQLYAESGQYVKAKPYLYFVWKSFGGQVGTSGAIKHMKYLLFLADSATGDYRSAMIHLADLRGAGEYSARLTADKEMKKLEVEYRAKENESALQVKDQHIKLLNQDYKVREATLKQYSTERNFVIAAIVLLVTTAAVLYRHYRHRQRANALILKKNEVITDKNELITVQNEMISKKNQQLEVLVTEKEWLLKEVHHRVKNNLQRVIRLLQSQAAYLQSDALKAIEKSQHRIYTMSLIHQKLYQSDDVQSIDMGNYIPELVEYLKESFEVSDKVEFIVTVDRVDLDPALAIPVGLIINEALTNAIKYAFPGDRHGRIHITFSDHGDMLKLKIADDGIGMDQTPDEENPTSLGLELIKGLASEIQGEVGICGRSGVRIVVTFKKAILYFTDLKDTNLAAST